MLVCTIIGNTGKSSLIQIPCLFSVHISSGFCEERGWAVGPGRKCLKLFWPLLVKDNFFVFQIITSHSSIGLLGDADQCGSHGHAEIKDSARFEHLALFKMMDTIDMINMISPLFPCIGHYFVQASRLSSQALSLRLLPSWIDSNPKINQINGKYFMQSWSKARNGRC